MSNKQIEALQTEAAEHGDLEMAEICEAALSGDADAIAECVAVIAEAAAQ
tara:strand:+ start:769 stop:918 length:150 start_codon:yes stop_codon:yes gene_type:complete